VELHTLASLNLRLKDLEGSVTRVHEKRRLLFEESTQSQISTSILKYTTIKRRRSYLSGGVTEDALDVAVLHQPWGLSLYIPP